MTPELPAIRVGAEVAFFSRTSRHDMSRLCVEGTKVLLVELPFESWDARVAEIWLTAKCRRLIPLFLDISARMAAAITKNLMADETKELDRLLVKVISQPTKETSK